MSETKIPYYLSFGDVIRMLRLIDETPFRELEVELDGLKVRVVQDKDGPTPTQAVPAPATAPEPVQPATAPAATPTPRADGEPVLAPLAGTFYRAPFPGEPPFVEVGTAVKEGDIVGILEIMKLMSHVTAPCAGVISEICAKNEEFVEFGQVLALIDIGRAA